MADQIDNSNLDIREQIARIDRAQAETVKFGAEQRKLSAEAQKFEREWRWYVPLAFLGNGAIAAIIGALVAKLLH